ncbi:hypothetical protein ISF_01802 [Cordyceps fumosorosea ARSEF 2679]|uniref:Uncharacterized protein n=1 Tax=Cordyceps fumosorosea (strain ARSEF 2679) TaxID=1081104 RepID=A0A168CDD5_CORFA|nr:hypothetical protein ISF_01802 [Cordyceps fumosorosea ARSEF 2679]OAA71251.1 hypothetical protein ISF_01802 [Cordyceps fumosorosea ARSEF 2679]
MDNQQRSPSAASPPSHPHSNLARQVASEMPSLLSRIVRRSDDDRICSKNETCGRGISPNATNLAIALGVVIPVVAAAITFFILHRRSVKRMHMEDAKYRETDLDYGLDEPPSKGKRMTAMFGAGGEKQQHRPGQLSMDMNLSSPYLLPPDLNQSKESIHSLAKSYHNRQDPYHTVPLYSGGDGSSIRSFPGDPYSPISSKRQSFGSNIPPRSHSKPQSPLATDPFATPTQPQPAHMAHVDAPTSFPNKNLPVQPIVPEIGTVHEAHVDDQSIYEMPDVPSPPAALAKDPKTGLPVDNNFRFELPGTVDQEPSIGVAQLSDDASHQNPQSRGLGLDVELPTQEMHGHAIDNSHVVHDDHNDPYPQIQTTEYYEDTNYVVNDMQQGHMDEGLGVPQTMTKRLSVGVVPLPPAEVTQSEDPEYRANRIRSFYKEYFEDYADAPPLPGQAEPHDDYNAGYLGDAAYYDADSNAFVMPYAQPVTRRAMTPPPGGARRGPTGPGRPRGPGSVGGMSLPGGRGRMRAGSHGQFSQPPKKRLPPPAALNTLPTPSKLRDDTALLNAMDFAPPELFKDQAAGRSQSPLGERRPYKPGQAGASPLVTAFDELAALPSPHLLRKSSTFTGLDFAPPKKFKGDSDMSDAGSIRSNRSGISAVQLDAIRSGAGRVSRLPGDTVFTTSNFGDQLKPQWGMRP